MRDILEAGKRIGINQNVSFRVIDQTTGKLVQEHIGHNTATNSMLLGIGRYLTGAGVLNQGPSLLLSYVPQYISLGTMGLINQDEDEEGLPAGIGVASGSELSRFQDYMKQRPGYGADGYDENQNHGRKYMGLGPTFDNRPNSSKTVNCELTSLSFPRVMISFRDVVPETESELPQTIDVIFSAMISTGALSRFREPGRNHLFITEAGLWSRRDWVDGGDNGLLAGYRIAPPNQDNWDMTSSANRRILKQNIIRVGINQVVQVIWKVQLGSINQFGGYDMLRDTIYRDIVWNVL